MAKVNRPRDPSAPPPVVENVLWELRQISLALIGLGGSGDFDEISTCLPGWSRPALSRRILGGCRQKHKLWNSDPLRGWVLTQKGREITYPSPPTLPPKNHVSAETAEGI